MRVDHELLELRVGHELHELVELKIDKELHELI